MNVGRETSKGSDQHVNAQSDQRYLLEYFMPGKLLTEQHLEFLFLTAGGCTGSPDHIYVKIPTFLELDLMSQLIF